MPLLNRHTGQANEAIFITSFAAESNINFQFSECHLPWLTDIINRKCTKIPPINSISHEFKMCAHVCGCFSHKRCFVVCIMLFLSIGSLLVLLFLLLLLLLLLFAILMQHDFGLYYAINHPSVNGNGYLWLWKPVKLIWQIQWKCHPQWSHLSLWLAVAFVDIENGIHFLWIYPAHGIL